MKRIFLLLTFLILLGTSVTAACEIPGELIRLAAQHHPDCTVLDGMLTEETALLLLENADGQRYLAAGTLEGGDARFSLSSPLPEGMHARFEPALPCTAFLYFEHPDRLAQAAFLNRPGYADCTFRIDREADGCWRVTEARGVTFGETCVYDGHSRCCWGEFLLPREMSQVDWLTFPLSVQEAAAHMDASGWAIAGCTVPMASAPEGAPFARYNPGTPLLILDRRSGWVEVAVLGGVSTGWVPAESLITGAAQAETQFLTLDDLPLLRLGQQEQTLSVLFHPETDVVLAVLDGRRDSYLSVLGVWESGWVHVYDRRIPGIEGFVRQEDLTSAEDGHG
ncbi:MAG: hypothetical protein E7327_11430 [Clostridiales bacterium]|nr:hypothetical protein [Clostridiales bacterium]